MDGKLGFTHEYPNADDKMPISRLFDCGWFVRDKTCYVNYDVIDWDSVVKNVKYTRPEDCSGAKEVDVADLDVDNFSMLYTVAALCLGKQDLVVKTVNGYMWLEKMGEYVSPKQVQSCGLVKEFDIHRNDRRMIEFGQDREKIGFIHVTPCRRLKKPSGVCALFCTKCCGVAMCKKMSKPDKCQFCGVSGRAVSLLSYGFWLSYCDLLIRCCQMTKYDILRAVPGLVESCLSVFDDCYMSYHTLVTYSAIERHYDDVCPFHYVADCYSEELEKEAKRNHVWKMWRNWGIAVGVSAGIVYAVWKLFVQKPEESFELVGQGTSNEIGRASCRERV